MMVSTLPETTERDGLLRKRLGLLCHAIRWVSAVWFAWAIATMLWVFSDRAHVVEIYGRLFEQDLSGLTFAGQMLALGVVMADLAVAALVVLFVWRLFGHYLNGRIFSLEAAGAMRCLGLAGIAAVAADLVARPLLASVLTWHLPEGQRSFNFWTDPNDLLHLTMALFIVALAHVFKTGVEIADENRQIV